MTGPAGASGASEEPGASREPAAAGPPAAVVAAFDFDGTLTTGGSVWPFLAAVAGWPAVLAASVPLAWQFALAGVLGGHFADEAKERLFRALLAGRPAEAVAERAEAFGRAHFGRRARPEMVARLRAHLQAGHRVVIVSASPELYLRSIAASLGADEVIATRLAVDGAGRLTGGYDGANCRGAEKARRLRAWVAGLSPGRTGAEAGAPATAGEVAVWAYGNSAGDRAMLQAATVGVAVGRLGRLGRLRGFPVLHDAPDPRSPGGGTPRQPVAPPGSQGPCRR